MECQAIVVQNQYFFLKANNIFGMLGGRITRMSIFEYNEMREILERSRFNG